MTGRHAQLGDRFVVDCHDVHGQPVTATVTAEQITRLICGCDRVHVTRPGGHSWRQDCMALLPTGCYHSDVVDFDAARAPVRKESR